MTPAEEAEAAVNAAMEKYGVDIDRFGAQWADALANPAPQPDIRQAMRDVRLVLAGEAAIDAVEALMVTQ